LKIRQQGLGHDGITNPVRGNDQNTMHVWYPETAPRVGVLLGLVPVGLGTWDEFVLSATVRALGFTRFSKI
jgi:hypothetical protein